MRTIRLLSLPLLMIFAAGTVFAAKHTTPTEITAEIQDKLYHARVFEHGQVQVSFDNGVATLTGTVESAGVKRDAERAVRKVDDVASVVDNINVHAEDVTPQQIVEQARKEILTYYAYGIFDWVTLETRGNALVVNGAVSQPFKKDDIGNFLAHIKGVTELVNNLEALPTSSFDDSIRLAVARSIYNDPYFVRYAVQANPPIHIIVKNGNVTLYGVVATSLDRAKAEADAATAGTYFKLSVNLLVESQAKKRTA